MHKDSTVSEAHAPPLRTRQSLLSRLRNLDDHASWRTFFDIYWRLIYDVARHSGLDDAAAQEVVQDTVIGVARAMPAFRYNPDKGTFRQWLLRVTRRRIIDQFRRIYRQPVHAELTQDEQEDDEASAAQVADYSGGQFECAWREEWERTVFRQAVAQVQREVNPKHFQVFDFCVLKDMTVSRVAETLGLNAAQVYLAKHRVNSGARPLGSERVTCRNSTASSIRRAEPTSHHGKFANYAY